VFKAFSSCKRLTSGFFGCFHVVTVVSPLRVGVRDVMRLRLFFFSLYFGFLCILRVFFEGFCYIWDLGFSVFGVSRGF
jgi:hypothetical protein